jgi:hypothetical protein
LVHLGTGDILRIEKEKSPRGDPEEYNKEAKRYGLDALSERFAATGAAKQDMDRDEAFLRQAASYVWAGKKILAGDGFPPPDS